MQAVAVEIGAMARRLRAIVVAASVVLGVAIGAAGYASLRSYFLSRSGMSSPIAIATMSFLPALAGALYLARRAAPWIVAQRRPSWISEAARRHAVDAAELEELTSLAGR